MKKTAYIEKHNLLKHFMDISTDGWWDWYPQEDYEYMSPRFWEIFGFDPKTKKHHPSEWMDLIFPEDLEKALSNFKKHVATKGKHPYKQLVRYRHKNGSTVYVNCTGKAIEWDKNGEPLRVIGIHSNMTEIIHTKKKLEESQERYELAINGASVGIWDWDFLKNTIFWSQKLRDILKITNSSFIPTFDDFLARLHPDDHKHAEGAIKNHLEHRKPYETEFRLKREDGVYIWLHVKGQAIWDQNKNPVRFSGSADDVTDKKKIEEEKEKYLEKLHKTNKALQRSNEELERFTYASSHDLMSPLRAIHNLSNWILEDEADQLSKESTDNLKLIQAKISSMEDLLVGILEFSRLNNQGSETIHIDPKDALTESINLLELPENTILELPETFSKVTANKAKLQQVFLNLLNNAIKYRSLERNLILKIWEEENPTHVTFFIEDNGIGFDEKQKKNIFKIFSQLHQKGTYEGIGLGLSLVKKIIEQAGGHIDVTSSPGKGSTFFFTLPK